MSQPLFDAGPATLTARQTLIMRTIHNAGEDGIRADEAGAVIHALRGAHAAADRCRWCVQEGGYALRRLQELCHVRRDRHGNWRATTGVVEPSLQGDLPEGF